jgi:hypothetical protein
MRCLKGWGRLGGGYLVRVLCEVLGSIAKNAGPPAADFAKNAKGNLNFLNLKSHQL